MEHRYYGESNPFSDYSTAHLKYLTSEQALADAAQFLEFFVNDLKKSDQIRKVIVVGGSYTGAMSSWFRMRFPNLVIGSIASSAPVYLQEEFMKYDEHISQALPPECQKNVVDAMDKIDALIDNGEEWKKMIERTKCEAITNPVDWEYVLADAVAWAVQYNSYTSEDKDKHTIDLLCSTLNATDEKKDIKDKLFDFIDSYYNLLHPNCLDASSSYDSLKNETLDPAKNQRQWFYQSCTEFGYFQVASTDNTKRTRSTRIDLAYHRALCKKLYNIDVDITPTKKIYMQDNMIGTNIIWTNGDVDPWMELSITPDDSNTTSAHTNVAVTKDGREKRQNWRVLLITNGSHCSDLGTPSPEDSESLTHTRTEMRKEIDRWIATSAAGSGKYNTRAPLFIFSIIAYVISFVLFLCGVAFIVLRFVSLPCFSSSYSSMDDEHIDEKNASKDYQSSVNSYN